MEKQLQKDTMTMENKLQTSRRWQCPDVFLFSQARTASNLLCRQLSGQPGWTQSSYHFRHAFEFAHNLSCKDGLSEAELNEYKCGLDAGFAKLEKARDAAVSEDKCLLVKNHICHVWDPSWLVRDAADWVPTVYPKQEATTLTKSNPTLFTDDYLMLWTPVFIIRHPILMIESWYKAETRVRRIDVDDTKSWAYATTYAQSRQLYDWYKARTTPGAVSKSRPIVIDADDVIEGGEALARLCRLCNMDPSCIRHEWEAKDMAADGNISPRSMSFMGGFWTSTSVDKTKTSRIVDAEAKYGEWKKEFGTGTADALRGLVQRAMGDYDYLKKERVVSVKGDLSI